MKSVNGCGTEYKMLSSKTLKTKNQYKLLLKSSHAMRTPFISPLKYQILMKYW